MLDAGHQLPLRRRIARQLVRDQDARRPALPLEQLPQQALGRFLVPPALDQHVEHGAVLVDGPPQPMLLAGNFDLDLIEVPLVAGPRQPAADLVRERLAELQRPLPHRLVADGDAAGGQQLLDHPQAEREAEVEPDRVADDLRREAVTGVGGRARRRHARPVAGPPPARNLPRANLTVPLKVPVVIAAGAEDRYIDTEAQSARLHHMLPGSGYRVVPGAGHMVHHTAPDEAMAVIALVASRAEGASARSRPRLAVG